MARRVIFLDVDGTLVDHAGEVPHSARVAVHAARDNGHLVYLCTGRSLAGLWADILSVGFDGVIAAAGGYVEAEGKVLSHHHMPNALVSRLTEYLQRHEIGYFLESNDGIYGSQGVKELVRELILGSITDDEILAEIERGTMGFVQRIRVGVDPMTILVNKVSFLSSSRSLEQIEADLGDALDVIPSTVPLFGPNSGELSMRGVHKAAGIQVVLDHLGLNREDTVAFGDGYNDLEMLEFAGVGVAMGQAPDAVKEVADRITGSPREDGIARGFAELGLV